mgnify:CR=1 FL=1
MHDPDEVIRSELVQETARISWQELQRFFANGSAIAVDDDLDLIDVAIAVRKDNSKAIKAWMSQGRLGQVSDQQAMHWHENNTNLWAVVIKPWVLVQDKE